MGNCALQAYKWVISRQKKRIRKSEGWLENEVKKKKGQRERKGKKERERKGLPAIKGEETLHYCNLVFLHDPKLLRTSRGDFNIS